MPRLKKTYHLPGRPGWHILLLVWLALFILPKALRAQGENNIWSFGWFMGLDFNSGTPEFFIDSLQVPRGSAAVSDAGGNLLFYTSGGRVWNRQHAVMPNGNGLLGNGPPLPNGNNTGVSKGGVVIILSPQNPNQYYIVTSTPTIDTPTNVYCSIVDMSLDNGLGDVLSTFKNEIIATDAGEYLLTANKGGSCAGYWLIMHERRGKNYMAFSIDANGISATPVLSQGIAGIDSASAPTSYINGSMCLNRNGNLLVRCEQNGSLEFYNQRIEVADFDNITGSLSNFRIINADSSAWSYPTFSADGSKLYCTANGYDALGFYQFDLSLLPDTQAVQNSKTRLGYGNFHSSKLGPDDKIYVVPWWATALFVVHNPNNPAATCGYDSIGIPLPANLPPNMWPSPIVELGSHVQVNSPNDTIVRHIVDTVGCLWEGMTLQADSSWQRRLWSTGSTASTQTFTQSGTYWVRGISNCTAFTDTFHITFNRDSLQGIAQEHVLCKGETVTIIADTAYEDVVWSTGSNGLQESFSAPGTYWLYGSIGCTVYIDSFQLQESSLTVDLGSDTTVCDNLDFVLDARVGSTASCRWQDGQTGALYQPKTAGIYYVTVTQDGCEASDTVAVDFLTPWVAILENDTLLCEGVTVQLHASAFPASSYLWNTGSNHENTSTELPGFYTVTATNACGNFSDSVLISYKHCPCSVFVPNAFTPNSDGRNDKIGPQIGCPAVADFRFAIYNRLGQKVFESLDSARTWDGLHGGIQVDAGTYYFYLTFKDLSTGTKVERKGDITVVR